MPRERRTDRDHPATSWGHGNEWWVREQERRTAPAWRRREGGDRVGSDLVAEELSYAGLPLAPEEDCLWDGNPTWQGDTAPRRATLRRVPNEWDDLTDDVYVEGGLTLRLRLRAHELDAEDAEGCTGAGLRANAPGYDQCPVCGRRTAVKLNGRFRKHGGERGPYAPGLRALGGG